jgi:hypothetical protein
VHDKDKDGKLNMMEFQQALLTPTPTHRTVKRTVTPNSHRTTQRTANPNPAGVNTRRRGPSPVLMQGCAPS